MRKVILKVNRWVIWMISQTEEIGDHSTTTKLLASSLSKCRFLTVLRLNKFSCGYIRGRWVTANIPHIMFITIFFSSIFSNETCDSSLFALGGEDCRTADRQCCKSDSSKLNAWAIPGYVGVAAAAAIEWGNRRWEYPFARPLPFAPSLRDVQSASFAGRQCPLSRPRRRRTQEKS